MSTRINVARAIGILASLGSIVAIVVVMQGGRQLLNLGDGMGWDQVNVSPTSTP